eukprot:Transcript_6675.p2 GENE.Transcript_6675~~Transcript_6675.p2  ORF type:complete len:286 (-),score=93.66 Transcript_6675:113-970(-)
MVARICRAVSTRHQHGGMDAPAPIVSRIFQELSNGALAYNAATKMKEVPVPFAYVQFNALLLCLFTLITPLAIAAFTQQTGTSIAISCIVVGGFSSMWLVANELEDPFGDDANDLPMLGYHEHFVRSLLRLTDHAWLPRDEWVVPSGPWSEPAPEQDEEAEEAVQVVDRVSPALSRAGPGTAELPPPASQPDAGISPAAVSAAHGPRRPRDPADERRSPRRVMLAGERHAAAPSPATSDLEQQAAAASSGGICAPPLTAPLPMAHRLTPLALPPLPTEGPAGGVD